MRLIVIMLASASLLGGCATVAPPPELPDPARLTNLGTVRVDPVRRVVVATGHVNQVEGAIELFACGPRGKTHESVLVLDAYPVDLHAALLLLGAKCGPPAAGLGQGPPRGDRLDIWIAWDAGGRGRMERAERLIAYRKSRKPMRDTFWVFTGSTFEDGRYKALVEESLVVTYWDPWAVINIGSGDGADDERLSVNEKAVPPLGTPVTVYFVPSAAGQGSP